MSSTVGIMVVDYDLYLGQLSGIKNEIKKENIEVAAITNGWMTHSNLGVMDGFCYFDLDSFFRVKFDYLIVAANDEEFRDIKQKVGSIVPGGADSVFPVGIFGIMDFDFTRYTSLAKSNISIISYNCWGGLTYANLKLKFMSPTINTRFENEEHYLRFISNLDHYLSTEIKNDGTEFEEEIGEYPVGLMDDVRIRFVHYKSFDEAVSIWNERKQRINRDNLFFMLYTEKPEMAKLFDETIDYNKVVFTAGDFGVKCQVDLTPLFEISSLTTIGHYAFMAANEELHLYDAIKMLNGDMDYLETRLRV